MRRSIGAIVAVCVLALAAGAILAEDEPVRTGSASGKTVGPDGAAVAGANVAVQQHLGGPRGPSRIWGETTSEKDGSFKIDKLPAGTFKLVAWKDAGGGNILFYSGFVKIEDGKQTDAGSIKLAPRVPKRQ